MSGNQGDGDVHKGLSTDPKYKISDRLYGWCQSKDSVSSLLAANPDLTPTAAWQELFHENRKGSSAREDDRNAEAANITDGDLSRAGLCGKWGTRKPSDLFMKLYHDALCTLDADPERGVVSPNLMGSCGTVPLTIISVLPDIVRHMSNLIVRAQKEVFLATNFWQNSIAARYITNALRELSRRAQARGDRVVVKVIYDRGNPRQVFDPHYIVLESDYTGNAVKLPPAKDIPNVDLQVINYHQPILGTFHAKYMIVDRRIAIIQSNNIQDNDNLEMMVQIEGPIVDSLYDVAMISWHKKPNPPFPCLRSPAVSATESPSFVDSHASVFSPTGSIMGHSAIIDPEKMLPRRPYGVEATTRNDGITNSANQGDSIEKSAHGRPIPNSLEGDPRQPPQSEQSAVASQQPSTGVSVVSSKPPGAGSTSEPLLEHTTDDPHYDNDLAGEIFRVQAAVSAKSEESAMLAVTKHLNHTMNEGYAGDAPDCDEADEMTPYIPYLAHEPIPMALVNRAPYGRPNHQSVTNPQNAAWISALRNAERNVFIQTPTLNAQPLIPEIVQACERGIHVYCYVCLGYNDAGEMLPMQGGHNEKVSHQLHTALSSTGRQHLHWHWYVAKDQMRPIPAIQKRRSCHIKLMIVDETIGIVGSGNQDTQSWFHSQEINLMIDSPQICRAWIDALRRNQNTGIYGAVREDGIWRDEKGGTIEGAIGVDAGRLSWFHGAIDAVKRLKGTGNF
ncbi:hypothetical protein F5Y14DRAFT_170199 [Nemania sp. NC0429]|nr:hypothetical protein F5Y14DRAFT_170199 [Nemania sp. NC0429]